MRNLLIFLLIWSFFFAVFSIGAWVTGHLITLNTLSFDTFVVLFGAVLTFLHTCFIMFMGD